MRTIPLNSETPEAEIEPLELDRDLTRRDVWMFAPLLAVVIALPIVASVLFGLSVWQLANREEASLSSAPPTFASRWPEQSLPVIR
jgi:hypothetical protein